MPQDKSKCADELSASAADLKFLHRVPRVRLRNFKSKSGTRIIELLVPFGFRSSYSSVPRFITNFENRALVFHPAAREELFQPVDVVIAVDHVLLAHQRAEQRQRRL